MLMTLRIYILSTWWQTLGSPLCRLSSPCSWWELRTHAHSRSLALSCGKNFVSSRNSPNHFIIASDMWRFHQQSCVVHLFALTILYDWIQTPASRNNNLKTQKNSTFFTSPLLFPWQLQRQQIHKQMYVQKMYTQTNTPKMYTQTNLNNSLIHLSSSLTTSLCVQTPAPSHHWPSLLASGFNLELERLWALINVQWSSSKSRNHPLSNLGGQLPSNISDLSENARTSCRRSAQLTLSYESRIMISEPKIARWT